MVMSNTCHIKRVEYITAYEHDTMMLTQTNNVYTQKTTQMWMKAYVS